MKQKLVVTNICFTNESFFCFITCTAYQPTALPTVGPYALPVPRQTGYESGYVYSLPTALPTVGPYALPVPGFARGRGAEASAPPRLAVGAGVRGEPRS